MEKVTFREVQWMRRVWWVMLVIAGIALLAWYSFCQQIVLGRPVGTNPGPDWAVWLMALVFGLGFPAFFATMRLVVEVREDHVYIRYVPLLKRRIPLAEIARCLARTYRPIVDYGGWGIKGWGRQSIAYSISGNQGVELELVDGRRVMIGSRRAKDLAAALAAALAAERK